MFLKNRHIISKIKRSKVTDYAALNKTLRICDKYQSVCWPISGAEVFGVVCLGTCGCLRLERLVLVFVWDD